jgi:hypothetical protein
MDLRNLNKQLMRGVLPDELNFTIQARPEIDINKIKYNAFYRSYEFAESKFPEGYECIPGFSKVIDLVVDDLEQTTPLEEMLKRKSKPKEDANEN